MSNTFTIETMTKQIQLIKRSTTGHHCEDRRKLRRTDGWKDAGEFDVVLGKFYDHQIDDDSGTKASMS